MIIAWSGYRVGNTLSESGSVARGVCATNEEGYLTGVVERTAIERIDGDIQFVDENGKKVVLEENTPVSMNMWGFTPDYFGVSEEFFKEFLKANMGNLKSEYFIPLMVNKSDHGRNSPCESIGYNLQMVRRNLRSGSSRRCG